jgi:Flp pilus assembly protein TadG
VPDRRLPAGHQSPAGNVQLTENDISEEKGIQSMCRKPNEKGNSYIEFVLVASFFFVPLILGMITLGIAIVRDFQVNQLTRDVGHMMAKGVDFSQQANQNLVANDLANGLSLQANSGNVTGSATGNGVLVLSTFQSMSTSCNCANGGHVVLVDRIVIGNNTLYTSPFGNPASIQSNGNVANYATDTGAQADNVSSVITISPGGLAYMAEGDFAFKDLGVVGFIANLGAFNRVVF